MKCPICGTENGADFKFCKECAHPLRATTDVNGQTRFSQSESTPQHQEDKGFTDTSNISTRDDIFADSDNANSATTTREHTNTISNSNTPVRRVSFFDDDEDTIDTSESSSEQSDDNAASRYATRSYNWDEKDDYDLSLNDKQTSASRRKQAHKKNLVLWITIAIVFTALITVFCVFLSVSYDGNLVLFFNTTFTSNPITHDAVVSFGETETGDPAILIKVYARKGYTVRFQEGDLIQDAVIQNTSVTFCIPQSIWIPNDPIESSSITVTPTIYVIEPNGSGEVIQVKIDPIEIKLPAVIITLDKPETNELITSDNSVEISGSVSDPTATVFIGDTQLQTDQNGYFRGIYHMDTLGEHEVFIEARKPGTEVVRTRLLITYTKTDLALTVTNESMRTFEDTIEISGVLDRGAQLSVSGIETIGDINVNSEDGTFSFTASVPEVGLYTPTLSVTAGNVTSTITVYIEHAPNIDDYIYSSRSFDYENVIDRSTMDRHYEIRGTIVEVQQVDPYVIATMLTNDGDYLTFRYYHTTTVEANDGKDYKIYAYPTGLDSDGRLTMYCWFIYKSE